MNCSIAGWEIGMSEKAIEAAAAVLLGRVNAPEQEIYRATRDAIAAYEAALWRPIEEAPRDGTECHGLDTPERVFFYEQDFYVLSNFSAFTIMWEVSPREGRRRFDTSEAVYHWEKFNADIPTQYQRSVQSAILEAPSAHEAFKIAEANKAVRRPDWDVIKIEVMREILREKAEQHEYVRRKLLATGDRELVENSWRDDFWGWGPNRDGQNMLGKLWMEIRAELLEQQQDSAEEATYRMWNPEQ
jgi:ribA/ribD-fused uncharacterized protein